MDKCAEWVILWLHPFRDITVADVMTRAGSSRPTFYQYFADLHEVLETMLDDMRDDVKAAAAPWFTGEGDQPALLRESLTRIFAISYSLGPVMRAMVHGAAFELFDGVPTRESAMAVNDFVDRGRALEVFIRMIGTVNMASLRIGAEAIGAKEYCQIPSWQGLADSTSLILTGNHTSLYTWSFLDLKSFPG